MSCSTWNYDWVAHLYGELPVDEEQELLRHLEACSVCRQTMDDLAEARRLLAGAPAVPEVSWARAAAAPAWSWRTVGAFAAGVVCAALCFGMGLVGANYLGTPTETLPTATIVPPVPVEPVVSAEEIEQMRHTVQALTARLAAVEDDDSPVTLTDIQREISAAEKRFNRERGRDLEYLMQTMTASELRTASWKDRTNEALQLIALRQDPRFSER